MKFYALLLLALIAYKANGEFTPMVAFMCNKPSMYMTDNGWQKVDDIDCLHDPVDILNFCRRVYHDQQVTNVVQSSVKVTIGNWCQVNKPTCGHSEHTVTPFKCVVGTFQSEALLVPEHCVFDHQLDERLCQAVSEWQDTAVKACLSRGLALESTAPLSVCGIGRFHGTEFVCCPGKGKVTKEKSVEASVESTEAESTDAEHEVEEDSNERRESDVYQKYLHSVGGQYESEHDMYTRARDDLASVHKDKLDKVMKEWTAARQHVEELKKTNPKGAEKLESEVTERFQQTYSALQQELTNEKKQLSNIHDQRVQAKLNEKKRAAMDNYMDTLNDDTSELTDIVKALQTYIRVEQKDRLHTVNRYQHVVATDYDEAELMRPQIISHLDIISKRINQAINMLSRVPRLEKKIRVQIDTFMKDSFHEIDISVNAIKAEPINRPVSSSLSEIQSSPVEVKKQAEEPKPAADNLPLVGVEEPKHEQVVKKDGVEESPFDTDVSDEDTSRFDYDENSYEEDNGVLDDFAKQSQKSQVDVSPIVDEKTPEVVAPAAPTDSSISSDENSEQVYDDETMEDEHSLLEEINDMHGAVAHHAVDDLVADSAGLSRSSVKALETSAGKGAVVAIIVATLTLFIVLAVGVAVLRQKARQSGADDLEADCEDDGMLEDKHVNAMQVNGYENPTYKFFERST